MGDFSYLGADKLRAAIVARDAARIAFNEGDMIEAQWQMRQLDAAMTLDDVMPDDGAIDQFVTVYEAMHGDDDETAFLRECAEDDGVDADDAGAWLTYLASYALDDLDGTFEYALGELDA